MIPNIDWSMFQFGRLCPCLFFTIYFWPSNWLNNWPWNTSQICQNSSHDCKTNQIFNFALNQFNWIYSGRQNYHHYKSYTRLIKKVGLNLNVSATRLEKWFTFVARPMRFVWAGQTANREWQILPMCLTPRPTTHIKVNFMIS